MSFIQQYFGKTPEKITSLDIKRFVKRKNEENQTLDYKDFQITKDIDKLSKNVSAFANAEGGLIIVGVSEEKRKLKGKIVRIFPDKITWGDPTYTKEKLEDKLGSGNDPPVPVKIVPVRKSKDNLRIIFLLDIPRSNELYMHKKYQRFYKRLNFKCPPMTRLDVVGFIKERMAWEKCVWFRFNLKQYLIRFMDDFLIILDRPDQGHNRSDPDEILKLFGDFASLKLKGMVERLKGNKLEEFMRFRRQLSRFSQDLEKVAAFPHEEITPEERVIFDKLREEVRSSLTDLLWDKEYYNEAAQDHKTESNWRHLTYLEFLRSIGEEDHFYTFDFSVSASLSNLSRYVFRLGMILKDLESRYGLLKSSRTVQEIY